MNTGSSNVKGRDLDVLIESPIMQTEAETVLQNIFFPPYENLAEVWKCLLTYMEVILTFLKYSVW